MAHGAEVAYSVGHVLWMPFDEAFEVIGKLAMNLKDNLATIFSELWDYVKSSFSDPIDIKLKPILEGLDPNLAAKFKLPELNLSDTTNQRAVIQDRINQREADRVARAKEASDKVKANAAGQQAGQAGGTGKFGGSGGNVGIGTIDSFARELQEAALRATPVADRQITEIQETNKKLDQLIAIGRKPKATMGGYPATFRGTAPGPSGPQGARRR